MKKYRNMLAALVLSGLVSSVFAEGNQYMIIVDAGSSGSRLHIFQYHKNGTMPVIEEPVPAFTNKTGLASFVNNPDQAGASLQNLLDGAKGYLAGKVDIHTVPISVFGTAGMRLLKPEQQKPIYDSVYSYVKPYEFADVKAETIDGKMEGLYGWMDVNYLANNFQNHQTTVGSIDMGGASTQIAYAIPKKNSNSNEWVTVNINNHEYIVFSKSFLGLGQDQSRFTMMSDPQAASCYPKDDAFDTLDPSRIGAFDFVTCSGIYKNIIASKQVSEQILPMKDQSFIAYSGIYYTWHFFNADKTIPDQVVIEKAIDDVCHKETWEEMQKAYPTEKVQYLSAYCASASYENQLLYSTYGLKGYRLTVENQINQHDIDWTLGAALYDVLK